MRIPLALAALLSPFAAALADPSQTVPPLRLDAQDCETIRAYDRRLFSPSFLDQWAHMALTHESCGGSTYDCRSERMRRWAGGFTLTMPPQKSWESHAEEVERVAAGARDAARFYARTLGLAPEAIAQSESPALGPLKVWGGKLDWLLYSAETCACVAQRVSDGGTASDHPFLRIDVTPRETAAAETAPAPLGSPPADI